MWQYPRPPLQYVLITRHRLQLGLQWYPVGSVVDSPLYLSINPLVPFGYSPWPKVVLFDFVNRQRVTEVWITPLSMRSVPQRVYGLGPELLRLPSLGPSRSPRCSSPRRGFIVVWDSRHSGPGRGVSLRYILDIRIHDGVWSLCSTI